MLTSVWFLSLASLLVVDVRIRALQQKDVPPHRCHHCAGDVAGCAANVASIVQCPAEHPLCATSAVYPNFTSELTCAATTKTPCSLTHTADSYALVCTCTNELCNAHFSKDLQKQLLEFTSSNITKRNASDYSEAFFKLHFSNVSEAKIYKAITVETVPTTEKPDLKISHPTTVTVATKIHTTISHPVEVHLPRAEAFKHEPTALSEDDEDASEGSGAYEETRNQRQPASDPADPSSFLPASENKAPPVLLGVTFLVTTPILLYNAA